MTTGTVRIDGRKFRIIPEAEYQTLRAAWRSQQREDRLDLAEAQRRLKNPKRKTIPIARLKAELGL